METLFDRLIVLSLAIAVMVPVTLSITPIAQLIAGFA